MDPLSAIGLASAVISFVQFSADVVSGGKEVYNSISGQTEENIHIATVAAHLRGLSDELLTDIEGRTRHEKSLLHLARNCHALSLELLDVLESLAAKAGNPKWQSFKAGLRGAWKKDKVASLERALAAYKAELSLCLPLVLLDRQSFMREYLGQAVRDNAIWRSETSARMETQQQYLYQITKQLRNFQPQDEDRILGPLQDELGTVLDGIQSSLQNLQSMAAALPYETMILKRLYFSSIYNREDRVLKNTRSTFQWMTEGDHSQFEASDAFQETFEQWRETVFRKDKRERAEASKCFVDFLKYRQNGLFFICGKPGAGKSTMMKFLAAEENSRVRTMLRDWAGKEELVVVSVYFSRSTDELQMSLEGFYRSILFRMLKTCPALIWKVFPQTDTREQYWSPVDQPFRLPELAEAFKRLSEGSYNGIRFCLFIDGLDEYHAHPSDQLQLARSLLDWSRREDVKIVCGARPETSFIQVFQDSMTIYLHRLTASDIAEHAGAVIFKEIRAGSQTNVADLVKRIVQMAEGVFLWAYLVVRSLSRRINTYSERQLHSILDDTPAELTPLFSQMLDRIDPSEKAQSERILLALLEGTPYQNAMCVSWLEDLEDPTFPFTQNICAYPDDEIDRRLALVQQQVADLTGGLAEFIDSESRAVNARMGVKIHPFFRYEIGFFHRTARDFVANEWSQTQRRDTSIDFGTAETLARCHLALLRFSHSRKFHEKLMPHDGQLQPQKVWLDRAEPPEIVESFDLNLALRFIWLGDALIRSASATSTPSQISSRCMDSIIATFEGYLDICPDLQYCTDKPPVSKKCSTTARGLSPDHAITSSQAALAPTLI
ncbi:hypothetical protein GQ53DRAFT_876663 [Thozetella sp. PMI_491]|nr:hypothetical protein GQ53DRAFT_876663 [Thozetella sp. PMI_491]